MPPKILDWKKIDPERDFVFSMPKMRPDGDGTFVQLEVKDPDTGNLVPFIHQTPKLLIPFGVETKSEKDIICKFTFPGVTYDFGKGDFVGDEELVNYLKFLKSIDEHIVKVAHENSETWFKKKISLDTIREFHSPILKDPKDMTQYAPHFKTKLTPSGKGRTQYYDQYGNEIDLDVFKGYFAHALMNTFGVWFAGKSFGVSFRDNQLAVYKEDRNFTTFAIDTGLPPAKKQRTDEENVPEEVETAE